MIRRRAPSIGGAVSFPSSSSRTDYFLRRNGRLLNEANSTVADPIVPKKDWSSLRISGIVLLVGTFVSHFLLLYLAHKRRRKTPPIPRVVINNESILEQKGVDVDESFVPSIANPNKAPKQRKEQRRSIYAGIKVDSSSSSSSSTSQSTKIDFPQNVPACEQQRSYRRLSSESAASSADSHPLPQSRGNNWSMHREWNRTSLSSSTATFPGHTSAEPSHQGSVMAGTPVTAKMTESGSSSSSSSLRHKKKASTRRESATDCRVKNYLPSSCSSSSSSVEGDLTVVRFSSFKADGSVATLTSIGLGEIIADEPRSESQEGIRPVHDIPLAITTKRRRHYHHRKHSDSWSTPLEQNNSLHAVFGRHRDGEIAEHLTLAVSVDDNDEDDSAILYRNDEASKLFYRNHRQLLLIGTPSSQEVNSASSASVAIPLWVSNEEELIHHELEE